MINICPVQDRMFYSISCTTNKVLVEPPKYRLRSRGRRIDANDVWTWIILCLMISWENSSSILEHIQIRCQASVKIRLFPPRFEFDPSQIIWWYNGSQNCPSQKELFESSWQYQNRKLAQPGRARHLGWRCRTFDPCISDHHKIFVTSVKLIGIRYGRAIHLDQKK